MINRKSLLQKKFNTGFVNEKSGYPHSLDKCLKKYLLDYKIYGNSLQDGTETTSTSVSTLSLGENSKNLFDITTHTRNVSNATNTSYNNGVWVGTGNVGNSEGAHSAGALSIRFPTLPTANKQITVSIYATILKKSEVYNRIYTQILGGSDSYVKAVYISSANTEGKRVRLSYTYTPNIDINNVTFRLNNHTFQFEINTFQIEYGGLTEYKPHKYVDLSINDNILCVDLTGYEPLRKVNNDADYIDFKNQRIVRNIANDLSILETPSYESIGLPTIHLQKGTNTITAYDEKLNASNISAKYRSKKKD